MIKVLIVDDASFMRSTIRSIFEKARLEVVAEAKAFLVKPFKTDQMISAVNKIVKTQRYA